MVRKKRKTTVNCLVKTRGLASATLPLPVDIRDIDLPTSGSVRLAISTAPDTTAHLELNLEELHGNLVEAPDTYAQLKVLQLFRSHLKLVITAAATIQALPSETQSTFWQVSLDTFRFIFRLYIHPSMKAMRKTILPILDTLSIYDVTFSALVASTGSSLGDIVVSEVTRFLDGILFNPSSDVDAIVPLDQVLALCEYSTATDALWVLHHTLKAPHLVQLVQHCSDQLRLLSAPIVAYHDQNDVASADAGDNDENTDGNTQPSEVVVASERCLGVLKSVIILCTAVDKPSSLRLMGRIPSSDATSSALVSTLEQFVLQSLVLLATSAVHKDLVTTVGLATTLLLKVHVRETSAAHGAELTYVRAMSSWLLGDGSCALPLMPADTIASLSAMPQLALYRGFLNSITDESFVYQEPPSRIPLVEVLFTTVLAHCHSAHLTVRMYAFQVLEMFLRRVVQQPVLVLTMDTMYALLDTILLNWEHPAKKINQFMAPMFAHVVTVLALNATFDWTGILNRLLQQPEHHRSKYVALCTLLPKLDTVSLLQQHPTLLHGVLMAVGNQEVAASAASLFVQLLEALREVGGSNSHAPDLVAWSKWWVDVVVDSLVTSDTHLRLRIATYVVPILVKAEPASVAILLDAARTHSDARLWTLLEVVKCARKIMMEPPALTSAEITLGLTHASGDIRMSAYDMLCTNLKTTSLPSESDIGFIQTFLLSSSKSIAASLRMKLIIGLKAILLRIREGGRKTCRRDGAATSDSPVLRFTSWLEEFVVSCITPSATPQRLTMGLEILQLYTQIFDKPATLHSPAITNALLNAMISCWDRVRILSFSILETFPSPLPGYDDGLDALFDWAVTLCCSPRQRESDAGAYFMRLLYKQHDHLTFLPAPRTQQSCVGHIISLLSTRLDKLEAGNVPGEPPLIHGLLLATRYMLEDTPSMDHTWHATVVALFSVLWRALDTALVVVGDATSGVGTQALDATYAVVGEVSAIPPLRAKVDCRGHLILDDPDMADGDAEQRAVVGSWLAARETAAVLATLVKAALTTPSLLDTPTTAASVQRAGDVLLNALFELKHGGAVATVAVAYEDICKALLTHTASASLSSDSLRRTLAQCPAKWCDVLLHRLEHAEQQFILRRSAGFASSFVAILRAEPRNAAATLLPNVLDTLLRLARNANTVERARVHALNILKLLGQDAILAEDMAVFVPQLLTVAVHGFASTSWAVRNSSMMLFAAATQRAIGDKQVADGAAAVGVSAQDVFTRCKGLDTFLLQHLKAQVYPLLLFLSRLRPDDVADQHEASTMSDILPLDTFVPLVMACAEESHIFHRRMAAHALAAIVAPASIPAVAATLVEALQNPRCSNNKLHGSMLQLHALVKKYRPPLSGGQSSWMQKLDADLAVVLPRLLALRCQTNRGVFVFLALQVVERLSASNFKSVLWPLLYSSCDSASQFQLTLVASPGQDLYLQGVASCLVRAAIQDESAAPALLRGLTSPVFELRRSTTSEFSDRLDEFSWTSSMADVVRALSVQLVHETHPPTWTRQLTLLCALLKSNTSNASVVVSVSGAVDRILGLAVESVDPQATAPALELLGLVVHLVPHVLPAFVERVVVLSDENKPLAVRLATAKSVQSSHVLCSLDRNDVAVPTWIAVLDLLQDDDVDVRDVARLAAVEAISHGGSLSQTSDMVMLPLAIEYLSKQSSLAASPALHTHVHEMLEMSTTVVPWLTECLQDTSHLLLCQKIFEAESGNYFKQRALTVQLYTWYFVRTGMLSAPASIVPQAVAALQIWCESTALHAWVGGTTFFPDVFPRLHNLVVVTVADLLVHRTAHPELHALATALLPYHNNMHPLLFTALTVLKSVAADPTTVSKDQALASLMYLAPFWTTSAAN
ncbi:hypothetical protein DYB32_000651 [Aphanomyces invadans]|uniref:Uncharacterized protein n=1 Tax=Aphanomyces invadans TaxID=157072 RepID=A0A3R6VHT1_9STRA|nr:hypothetical protein DYB32_000651 [Aphanomyces invadans]